MLVLLGFKCWVFLLMSHMGKLLVKIWCPELLSLSPMLLPQWSWGVTCLLQDPRFVGSNLTEVDRFFQDIKILSTSPSGGTLSHVSRV